jgi:hypothetical protein
MLVSSKHLSLSSSVFRSLLKSGFQEGETLRKEGSVTLSLPEDDVYAFSLIMNIIHARNTLLPSEVTLSTLTSLAILVDKYAFHDSVTPWAKFWVTALDPVFPHCICEELFCWISVSWVFRLSEEFAYATEIASENMTAVGMYEIPRGQELSECLPIPEAVISR